MYACDLSVRIGSWPHSTTLYFNGKVVEDCSFLTHYASPCTAWTARRRINLTATSAPIFKSGDQECWPAREYLSRSVLSTQLSGLYSHLQHWMRWNRVSFLATKRILRLSIHRPILQRTFVVEYIMPWHGCQKFVCSCTCTLSSKNGVKAMSPFLKSTFFLKVRAQSCWQDATGNSLLRIALLLCFISGSSSSATFSASRFWFCGYCHYAVSDISRSQ